jgi:N-acetylglutamate synthase
MGKPEADGILDAYYAAFDVVVEHTPGAWARRTPGGTRAQVVGVPIPVVNGVFALGTKPDIDEIASLAEEVAGAGVPWSIKVRGEVTPDLAALADGHGLTARSAYPVMVREITAEDVRALAPAAPDAVRPVTGADHEEYLGAMVAGFGTQPESMAAFASPGVLDADGLTGYLAYTSDARAGGEVAAVGLTARTGEYVGVFNVATLPAHRRRGYGGAVTVRACLDAHARGGRFAYGMASEAGRPLYARYGAQALETWTYCLATA